MNRSLIQAGASMWFLMCHSMREPRCSKLGVTALRAVVGFAILSCGGPPTCWREGLTACEAASCQWPSCIATLSEDAQNQIEIRGRA